MGLKTHKNEKGQTLFHVNDFSMFLRVLYDATYLSPEHSEYALDLLSRSQKEEGLAAPIPNELPVAHRFSVVELPDSVELRESGIIYCNRQPYLLTIMTKGKKKDGQQEVIAQFSQLIYHYFCS